MPLKHGLRVSREASWGAPYNSLGIFRIGRVSELLASHAGPGSESMRASARLAGDLFYSNAPNQERIADH